MRSSHIGIFDSGFGGLHVLAGIVEELPEYSYLYLGDSARVPYGSRAQDEIFAFTMQGVEHLFSQGSQLVILACNTASSEALRRIQHLLPEKYPERRVLGVLVPSAEEVLERTTNKRVGVAATEATVRAGAFSREIKKLDAEIEVFEHACPLLVPLVERGLERTPFAQGAVRGSLKPFLDMDIDTLVLGCTHYGILESLFRDVMGPRVSIIDQRRAVPRRLRSYLKRHGDIESSLALTGQKRFFSTKREHFDAHASRFFGAEVVSEAVVLTT